MPALDRIGRLHWRVLFTEGIEMDSRRAEILSIFEERPVKLCPNCASPLGYHRVEHVGVTAGTLDNPEAIKAELHMFAEHEHAWARFDDGLPRQEGFPPEDSDFEDPDLNQ